MEGRPTAVSSTVVLPGQPTTGSVTRVPLGGDGFTAPIAAYAVRDHQVTGAVGGGTAALTIDMDTRFCSLVGWMSASVNQGTPADADFRRVITSAQGAGIPLLAENGVAVAVAAGLGIEVQVLWSPPPVILPGGTDFGQASWSWVNVDADVYRLQAYIYLFNIRVRETTPMGPLLWARGST